MTATEDMQDAAPTCACCRKRKCFRFRDGHYAKLCSTCGVAALYELALGEQEKAGERCPPQTP